VADVYLYEDIQTALGMTRQQLLYMCIMLGTDFNKRIRGLGPVRIAKAINDTSFDIYKLDAENCGRLKVNVCIKMLTISKEDHDDVFAALHKGN
jgi:5'-3' exonuclease